MRYYLTVDIGTGSTRVALVGSDGHVAAMRSIANTCRRDEAYSDSQYFLPAEREEKLLAAIDELQSENPGISVSAVTSAGTRQTLILLDREGKAFYALPNIDNRGRDFMDEITDREYIYEHSGKWVTEDFCAAKLYGLRKLRPELYDEIGTVVSESEWVAHIFTGKAVFEPSQACETQLYDLESKSWSARICELYGVDMSILPPLVPSGTSLGKLLPEMVRRFPMLKDAQFIVGGADTQAALNQTGIQRGDIAVISGTTSPVVTLTENKFYDEKQRVWTDANLRADGFVIEMNPGVTGLNYQRIKDALCPDMSYQQLEREFAKKKDFCCTASFSSLLFYEQRSLKNGGFFMRSPLRPDMDRVDMVWAVLADVACAIYEQLFRLKALTGADRPYILCAGGGFRSETLCRMLADLSGLELRLKPGFEEATVNGLVSICNAALGEETDSASKDDIVFTPEENTLIHSYHAAWSRSRLKVNQ